MTCPQNRERCTLCGFCIREKHKAQNLVTEKAKKFDEIDAIMENYLLVNDSIIIARILEVLEPSIDSDSLRLTQDETKERITVDKQTKRT